MDVGTLFFSFIQLTKTLLYTVLPDKEAYLRNRFHIDVDI